jgi:hypothetical protein
MKTIHRQRFKEIIMCTDWKKHTTLLDYLDEDAITKQDL